MISHAVEKHCYDIEAYLRHSRCSFVLVPLLVAPFSFACVSDPLLNKDTQDRQGTITTIDETALQYVKLWSPTKYAWIWWKTDKQRELIKGLFFLYKDQKLLLWEDFWNEKLLSVICIFSSYRKSFFMSLFSMSSPCFSLTEA